MNARVLVIGSGATGAVIAYSIRRSVPHLDLVIWDKGRSAGGRFTTSRLADGVFVDTGAQYFSVDEPTPMLVKQLSQAKVIQALTGVQHDPRHKHDGSSKSLAWMAPDGASSIPKRLLHWAGVVPSQSRRVEKIERLADGRLRVRAIQESTSHGDKTTQPHAEQVDEIFDAVVCTVPSPQVGPLIASLPAPRTADVLTVKQLATFGSSPDVAPRSDYQFYAHSITAPFNSTLTDAAGGSTLPLAQALKKVQYSVRHTLALAYTEPSHAQKVYEVLAHAESTTARHVDKKSDGVQYLSYIGFDSFKRQGLVADTSSSPATVVLHSCPYVEGADAEWEDSSMADKLLKDFRKLYPQLPEPTLVKKHRWRYSQVMKSFEIPGPRNMDLPVAALAFPSSDPKIDPDHKQAPVVLAGDYMTGSHLVGCIESGTAAAELLLRRLKLQH